MYMYVTHTYCYYVNVYNVLYCFEERPPSDKCQPHLQARCIRGCVANKCWVSNRRRVEYQLGGVGHCPCVYIAQHSILARLACFGGIEGIVQHALQAIQTAEKTKKACGLGVCHVAQVKKY